MSRIEFTNSLENGTLGDAAEVMSMFNELKTGANAIDDTNIGPSGISESLIVFSSSGHSHNGTNSALVALAVNNGNRGSVKVRRVTSGGIAVGSFSSNLNAAGQTAIDTVMAVRVLINTGGNGNGMAFHTGTLPGTATDLTAYSSRYEGGSTLTTYWWYVIVNTSTTPNEVYFYNGALAASANILVMLIGV